MNDRTTCFGCDRMRLILTEMENIFFWCKFSNSVVGKIKKDKNLIVYPKPRYTNKCDFLSIHLDKKEKEVTFKEKPFVKWLFKKWR